MTVELSFDYKIFTVITVNYGVATYYSIFIVDSASLEEIEKETTVIQLRVALKWAALIFKKSIMPGLSLAITVGNYNSQS